ncbi:hypothetical protein ACFVUS_40400 [Nocardia sp. NPDC058058]|uniref:hypothetical protein n=1 Tax=Nocardia sp. NPDC058058 TaxID=3346317 RepID=UPI0036DB33D2
MRPENRAVRFRRVVPVVLAGCLLAGCSDDATPGKYQPPEAVQFSYRWTATAGVDLTSDAAIVTRAVIESSFIAAITGTTSERDIGKYTYPGYTRAVDRAVADKDPSPYKVWDSSILGTAPPLHGTTYLYLAALNPSANATAPRTVDALTCVWFNGLSKDVSPPEKYASLRNPALTPQAVKLKLRAPQEDTPKLTALGHGLSRYPVSDVFGDWSVESIEITNRDLKGRAYQDPCVDLPGNPVPPEQLAVTGLTFYRDPLPTLDPSPGWPAAQ